MIIRLSKNGERIPLSLADINPEEGTISLIVMSVGKTTHEMSTLNSGEEILDVCGPLGQPTHIEKVGRVVLVGGGFGVAPLYPIARAFKAAGNEVITIMGARSRDLLIYEKELEDVSDRLLITTDDGSKGTERSGDIRAETDAGAGTCRPHCVCRTACHDDACQQDQ